MTGLLEPVEVTRREGISIEITRKLLAYLLSGRVQAGQRLPPERKLAAAFGVGRSVIREALKALTLLGLLEARLGDGTYVKSADAELLPQWIEWGLVLGSSNILDLLEARHHLEAILAGVAAGRRNEQAVADLRGLVAEMEVASDDAPRFATAEAAFLQRMTEAAGNEVLGGSIRTIRSLLQAWIVRLPDDHEAARDLTEAYARVVDAIDRSDPAAAREAMNLPMNRTAARIRLAIGTQVGLATAKEFTPG